MKTKEEILESIKSTMLIWMNETLSKDWTCYPENRNIHLACMQTIDDVKSLSN
jgi:hypothetical protein